MEKSKIKWVVLLIAAGIIFAVAAVFLILHLLPDENENLQYKSSDTTPVSSEPEVVLPDNPVDFASLKAINPDVCGWITVPGTAVDYEILQSSDMPESFYIDHDINRAYKGAGSIYIQKYNYNDFSDPNTVIYGHNMLNGSMFGTLKKFRNAGFFNENQYIYIYTPGHILTYRIFTAFIYDDRHILNSFNFYSEEGFQSFLDQSINPLTMVKNVRTDVPVTTKDKIVTLSTCTGSEVERYLVEGVLINDQLTK